MKTVAIISQKGGAGKTTLALHLATSAALKGRNTAIIDLDPQASAANWADRREAVLPVVLGIRGRSCCSQVPRGARADSKKPPQKGGPDIESIKLVAA